PASTTASAARLSHATDRQTQIDQGGRPITKAPASAGAFSFDPRRVPFPRSTGTVAPELQTCPEPRLKIARRFEIQLPTERNAVKKLFLLAASASLLLAGAASAADMAARPYTKAPVAPVAVYNWTGFYVGVNGGGGWAHKCWDLISVAAGPRPVAEGC